MYLIHLDLSYLISSDTSLMYVYNPGLSINEELTGCIANLIHSSELVVIFFSIQHRSDGHWVTPHIDLPLTLNGEVLLASTLLSYG